MGRTPRLFVISGPSGAGKGTLVSLVRGRRPDIGLTVSATTRKPRPGEEDGVAYHFLADDEFEHLVQEGKFLEWANVHGHRYGTLISEVDRNIAQGRSVILEIDQQGAFNVRKVYPKAVLIFIEPPSMDELERRLRGRDTEDERQIELRLKDATHEMELAPRFDARIVNDDVERAANELEETMDRFEQDGGDSQYARNQARN